MEESTLNWRMMMTEESSFGFIRNSIPKSVRHQSFFFPEGRSISVATIANSYCFQIEHAVEHCLIRHGRDLDAGRPRDFER